MNSRFKSIKNIVEVINLSLSILEVILKFVFLMNIPPYLKCRSVKLGWFVYFKFLSSATRPSTAGFLAGTGRSDFLLIDVDRIFLLFWEWQGVATKFNFPFC